MKNKILSVVFIIVSILFYQTAIAQKPVICLAERMNQRTSFDTNYFYVLRGLADNYYYWDNGKTLYIKFLNGSKGLQEKTKNIAKQWEQCANIHFQFVDDGYTNIRIKFTDDGYTYSAIGTLANLYDPSEATMLLDTSDFKNLQANVLHLFGHALGLQDEIYIPQNKINGNMENLSKFFNASKPEMEKQNFINKYAYNFANALKYDEQSIMLAPIPNIYAANKKVVIWNKIISPADKKLIATIYPKENIDYKSMKARPTLKFFDLKIVANKGFSFFPIFDFNNIGSHNNVYFSVVLVNKNGEPIKTADEDYNMNNQLGTFTETMFTQGNFKDVNRNKLSDVQLFIPQSFFKEVDVNNGVFAVFKAFYFDQGQRKIEWLYISKPFEVKL